MAQYEMTLDHENQARGQLKDVKNPDQFPGWVEKYKKQMNYKGFRHALISTRKYYYTEMIVANYKQLGRLKKEVC